ncbi:hypothetical protein [Streptomyces alfalfae]|uniref:Uncharacterized protein n=1 Tax=Streptomyces alfalfae TaxID=1642299 RepID=A0A7T4U0M2_9ACTN|nr:hypothetical protein [Streptomyces alfalfae]QQC91953.1 hypothetical protein I8755_28810 [Streptomyces alfalfae]
MADDESYCAAPGTDTAAAVRALGLGPDAAAEGPFAACVLCQEPTEYPESHKGSTLCPVCAWQEAERQACSG